MSNYSQFKKSPYCRGKDGKSKKIYPSEKAAWDSADYRKHESGENLHPYKCEQCGGWHITKNPFVMVTSGTNWILDETSDGDTYLPFSALLRG
ncbi:hypothetical protein FACS189442_4120 [Spirochaetia bacterium]|nr:hypothetical protein FACS189442_4120 [Spirochaetia bacterium]